MDNILYRRKNRKGFTLAELLMTVAILLIVFALAVPAVFAIQRNLRQKELDSKAEIIYTAVQDKLTELYSKGKSSEYVPSESKGIYSLGDNNVPADYVSKSLGTDSDGNPINETQSFYYFTSESAFAKSIIGDSTEVLSEDLKNGHWVVEYIPYAAKTPNTAVTQSNTMDTDNKITSAIVYAVYYSEGDDYDITSSSSSTNFRYAKSDTDHSVTDLFLSRYRYKEYRMDKTLGDTRIGYYGGSTAGSGSETAKFEVMSANINSGDEINTAEVKIKNPYSNMTDFDYTFTFKDTASNEYTMHYSKSGFTVADGKTAIPDALKDNIKVVQNGSVYYFVFTLDDLSNENTRFKYLYGKAREHTESENSTKQNKQLLSGTTLTLTVTASSDDKRLNSSTLTTKGNSLFDYNEKKESGTDKAFYISNGRHLQNLDESSLCTDDEIGVAKAYLENDISLGENSKFAEVYKDGKGYFNGFTDAMKLGTKTAVSVPDFKSVSNNGLNLFTSEGTGNTYTISGLTTTGSGLFKNITSTKDTNGNETKGTFTVSDIRLTGERVRSKGNNTVAGGLIGSVDNADLIIKNVQIYLDKEKGDIPSTITSEANMEAYRWIAGDVTGGFVGNISSKGTVTITNSSVSTVLGNDTSVTGGLVGENNGTVTVNESYTDNYAYGSSVAGMIGSNKGTAKMENCYTAGFIGVKDGGTGAGFVSGEKEVSVTNSYTIIAAYNISNDSGLNEVSDMNAVNFTYYRTGKKIKNENVWYLKDSKNVSDEEKKDGASAIGKVTDMKLGNKFSLTYKTTVNPYQLLGKSLSNYEYPRLNMNHYGDWTADYVPGALVYYEAYKDGDSISYGFEGANLEVSLISDKDVIGDGYGVLYKQDTTEVKPSSVTVSVNGASATDSSGYMLIDIANGNRLNTTINGVVYDIYPLSKEICNPDNAVNNFYERVTLTAKDNNNSVVSEKYYDFNPHFARTVHEVTDPKDAVSAMSNTISIRSPRHLYNLSKFYDNGYRALTQDKTYQQERNMVYSNYDWTTYTKESSTVTRQSPIGKTEATSFVSNYDGGCYRIGDISFYTKDGDYVGMFGYVKGKLSNIFLLTQYDSEHPENSYRVEREDKVERNHTLYAGVLAGKNEGNITNCAVAGYYLAQVKNSDEDGTIYGYENSTLYIGGLVGWNEGSIRNSTADNPKLSLNMFKANCYAGGFVGYNFGSGSINNCYALTSIVSDAADGKTVIAGFAAYNSASISTSYCASALTAQGTGTKAYAFGSNEGNGITSISYYLSQGSYRFVDKLYSYGRGDMNGSEGTETNTTGSPITYDELSARSNLSKAVTSSFNGETLKSDAAAIDYPFKAVIKNKAGEYVHFGEWTIKPVLGSYGMFYWEHETSGENNGYKFTYVGMVDDSVYSETTLCESHDDSGIITEYGYGYYISDDNELNANLSATDISGFDEANINKEAQSNLQNQVPGIRFFPYTTSTSNSESDKNKLYLSGTGQNGTVALTVSRMTDGTVSSTRTLNYTISPFFANAISLKTTDIVSVNNKGIDTTKADSRFLNTNPGFDTNSYEIRSAQQLQYINWNNLDRNTSSLVSTWNYENFNYLMHASWVGNQQNVKQTYDSLDDSEKTKSKLIFTQSHDLNAHNVQDYVPIACPTTTSTNVMGSGYSTILYTWFGSTFDGQSYKIQELSIDSKGYAVGLFGVTVGADLKNIIMYSKNNAVIQRSTVVSVDYSDPAGAYSLGGLVGVAYDYYTGAINRTITNCSIAGYVIRDNSQNQLTLGEANVGGLVGVSNVNVDRCSAVVNIEENATHPRIETKGTSGTKELSTDSITTAAYGNFIRVGGLCGAVKDKVTRSYSGGNISVGAGLLSETYASGDNGRNYGNDHVDYGTNSQNRKASIQGSSHVYISGIAGSAFTMNYANFTGINTSDDGVPDIENCYTYINFPTMEGTIRSISMITNIADRYKYGNNAIIKNCYYLESSAKLNYNLPYYYFSGDSDNSPARLKAWTMDTAWGSKAYESLLDGDVRILQQIFSYGSDSTKVQIENEGPISYDKLSADTNVKDSGVNLLNSGLDSEEQKWEFVTVKDNKGGSIDGKYSFNAGTEKLEGKNYPFPTIIREGTLTNVHYGEWPTDGPYWSQGNATIDLISDLNSDGIAEKTFTIEKANGDKNDLSGIIPTFEFDDNYVSSVSLVNNTPSNNKYQVLIKAKKTGSTMVKAIWEDKDGNVIEDADFTLTVTCNFSVSTDNEDDKTFELGKNNSKTVHLIAQSGSDIIDTSKNFKWDVSVSKTIIENTDDATVKLGGTEADHKTALTITGNGYDATITVKGIYTYQGNEYEASVRIVVKKLNFVGISNNSKFNEITVGGNLSEQYEAYFSSDNKPDYTNSSYYLYEYRDSSLVSNVTVKLTLRDSSGNEVSGSQVKLGDKVTSGNYSYYPIMIDTTGVDPNAYTDNLSGATICATITTTLNTNTYSLTLDGVSVQLPQVVHFMDGESTSIGNDVKVTEPLKKLDITPVSGIDFNSLHEGYFIEGWYADSEDGEKVKVLEADGTVVNGNVDGYVTDGKLTLSAHSVTLYPLWKRYEAIPADMSSVDDNGQYILMRIGTDPISYVVSKASGTSAVKGYLCRNVVDDNGTIKFSGIGDITGNIMYNLNDYLFTGAEIKTQNQNGTAMIYQVTAANEQIYKGSQQ